MVEALKRLSQEPAVWAAVVVVVVAGNLAFVARAVDRGQLGLLGDSFGWVNALFSGLAFVGVIAALLLQRQELGAQRSDLALTREEMQATREEMENQRRVLELQAFESKYFSMLRLLLEMGDRMSIAGGGGPLRGSEAFRKCWSVIRSDIQNATLGAPSDREPVLRRVFRQTCAGDPGDITPYFRYLAELVHVSESAPDDSDHFSRSLYAHLSDVRWSLFCVYAGVEGDAQLKASPSFQVARAQRRPPQMVLPLFEAWDSDSSVADEPRD